MKDFLIVYSSVTGNTEKVALAMQKAAEDNCDIHKLQADEDFSALHSEDYKVIFIGYWVDKGGPDALTIKYLSTLKDKKVVFFQTLGAEPDSDHAYSSFANAGTYLAPGNKVLGILSIRGAISPKLIAAFEKMPAGSPHAPTAESKARWAAAASHPDEKDLEKAADYMKNFLAFFNRISKFF